MGLLCALLEHMAVKGNSVTAWPWNCANGALTCAWLKNRTVKKKHSDCISMGGKTKKGPEKRMGSIG